MQPAVIIGGGLAGMSAAWELARRGLQVELYEKANRLGGKAGSERRDDGYYSDHGYHLFPAWYENVRQLMGEAGIDYDMELIPGERFIGSFKGRDDRWVEDLQGKPGLWKRFVEGFVFAWTIGELVKADDEILRQNSLQDFLDAVFVGKYRSLELMQAARKRHESLTLKALSNGPDHISALTCARMWRRWMSPWSNIGKPSWSALRGSLQQRFIEPLRRALEDQGVMIYLGSTVTDLELSDGNGSTRPVRMKVNGNVISLDEKTVIIAVPAELVAGLFPDGAVPGWAKAVSATKTGRMSAIDYELDPLVTTSPVDHFGFGDKNLTGFDITRHWLRKELPSTAVRGNAATKSVIQVIATDNDINDPVVLDESVKPQLEAAMSTDTFRPSATQQFIHLNTDARLYLNTVANNTADRARYDTPTEEGVDHLFLAGDYCETSIDVASMEAAVASGRLAAESALEFRPLENPVDATWVGSFLGIFERTGILRLMARLNRPVN